MPLCVHCYSVLFCCRLGAGRHFYGQCRSHPNQRTRQPDLVLRLDEQAFGTPDFNALNKDFRILGQNRAQQMSLVNGQMTSHTMDDQPDAALKQALFTIPALHYAGAQTSPIQIEVLPLSQAIRAQTEKDFFFDVQIEPKKTL